MSIHGGELPGQRAVVPDAVRVATPTRRNRRLTLPGRRGGKDSLGVAAQPPACQAPSAAMYLFPDGEVRSCCVSTYSLGNVRNQRIGEIWAGGRRRELVDRIAHHDYSLGCESCGSEVAIEGGANSYPAQFDWLAPTDPEDVSSEWPRAIGFYLSNTCNLQCVQCNGENSSSIRKHREGRAPLRRSYDDQFFEDLRPFLVHLRHAFFVGGEPFLSTELFRVWDLMNEMGVNPISSVVTNGTQWNERIEKALDAVKCSIVVSIDGATAETFESIRQGASFETVMRNLDHFAAYCERAGTSLTINHCLMPQNHHEFGRLMLMAEERGIAVRVCVVREPDWCSIAHQPHDEIRRIHQRLLDDGAVIADRLSINRAAWDAELDRIGKWAECGPEDIEGVGGTMPHRIAMFRRAGSGPVDLEPSRSQLREVLGHDDLHEVGIGPGDVVVSTSESADRLLGLTRGALLGGPAIGIQSAMVNRFGRMRSWEIVDRDDDRAYSVGVFSDDVVHSHSVAMRDAEGWADEVRVVFGLAHRPD